MKCDVLLFAQLREALGGDRVSIVLPDDATVADAINDLAARHMAIRDVRDRLAVAVNERYARSSQTLREGDVLALIPPVSGG